MGKSKFDKSAAVKKMISSAMPEEEGTLPENTKEPMAAVIQSHEQGAAAHEDAPLTDVEPRSRAGRKPQEKKIQASIYFTEAQLVALNEQSGYGKKERDKSALVRFGTDLVLSMTDEEYAELKAIATVQGCTPAAVFHEAVSSYKASL